MNERKQLLNHCIIILVFLSLIILSTNIIFAETEVKSCCEKTKWGAWCQNAPKSECDVTGGLKAEPTSCDAVSYCRQGCCYDSSEGICMENTPERVCSMNNGTWADNKQCNIPQCNFGCCVIGTQAAFVTLTRCKKLSAFYGLQVDFRNQITDELTCISLASLSDQGACVYALDYIQTCEFTSRQKCNTIKNGVKIGNSSVGGIVTGNISFYKDMLCSAEELGTNCVLTKETTCIEGKDEVYFKDSCGNPANIYDSSKVNDKSYWRKKVSKQDSCNSGSANTKSSSCGNCDYFSGSICKQAKKAGVTPKYGDYACIDLNCKDTSLGKPMKHGESWCSTDGFPDSVGSRYFRHICMNGQEIVEACADFRQEECIQDYIDSKGVQFSQAACRVNRWQDCWLQTEKLECENRDRRDCVWNYKKDNQTKEKAEQEIVKSVGNTTNTLTALSCFPLHPPGFEFWKQGDAQTICARANTECVVKITTDLLGNEEKDDSNCGSQKWINEQLTKCEALGDCGAKVNFIGTKGYKAGYHVSKSNSSSEGK